jgi:hypothetical protein
MNAKVILEFVDLAISLILTHLRGQDAKHTLLDVIQKGVQAYEDHTGEVLDPSLITTEGKL